MKLKVLHITNWFPTKGNYSQGIFIKEHIKSLYPYTTQSVYHIDTIEKGGFYKINKTQLLNKTTLRKVNVKLTNSYSIQKISIFLMLWYLFRIKNIHKEFDIINFHIAFPLLHLFKNIAKKINIPIVVTEHYSGYHYNFYLKEGHSEVKKMKKLFQWQKNFITVSNALANDIIKFSSKKDLNIEVVPNVVSNDFFNITHHANTKTIELKMCMITNWSKIKNPYPIFKAIQRLEKEGIKCHVTVGGNGMLIPEMKKFIKEKNLKNNFSFVGQLNKTQVAQLLFDSDLLLHNSNYETFSVICAESFCVGTPVIASAVGGIKELTTNKNGILIEDINNEMEWVDAIKIFMKKTDHYNTETIKSDARNKFNIESVGEQYYKALCNFANN